MHILNNYSENNFTESNIRNNTKIKKFKKKFEEKNFEYLKECNIDDLFNDLVESRNE